MSVTTIEYVWVLGQITDDSWRVEGVYSTKERAIEHGEPGWFIGRCEFDRPTPEGEHEFPESEWIE